MGRVERVYQVLGYESVPEYVRTAVREKLALDEEVVAMLHEAGLPKPKADTSKDR